MRLFGTMLPFCALGIAAASAQTSQPVPTPNPASAGEALHHGEYLKADTLLRRAALSPDGHIRNEGAFGRWEQVGPMLTNELPIGGLRSADDAPEAASPKDFAALAAATPRNAIAQIVKRAAATSIVILNEAHNSPRDRAFALQEARALRPLGYSYLAAETFNNASDWGGKPTTAAKLIRDGFVRQDTGYYTADPVFAGYVREALKLGYRPVSYEQTEAQGIADPSDSIAKREEAEAQNLEAFLRAHPGAKLLIHVGYSHVTEAPIGTGNGRNEWMAARLKRETGIDPLTIDQTSLTDLNRAILPLYAAAAARIAEPSIFMTGNTPLVLGPDAGAVDLQVVHPARAYRHGRPVWLQALGGHPVAIPRALLPNQGARLIQAFAADAPEDAIPLDQVLVEAGRPAPMLMVPRGKLRLAVQDPG